MKTALLERILHNRGTSIVSLLCFCFLSCQSDRASDLTPENVNDKLVQAALTGDLRAFANYYVHRSDLPDSVLYESSDIWMEYTVMRQFHTNARLERINRLSEDTVEAICSFDTIWGGGSTQAFFPRKNSSMSSLKQGTASGG